MKELEPIKKIYTFYALELIYSSMKYGMTNKWHSQEEIDQIEIVLLQYATKLKQHLLDIIEYSVMCEARHTKDQSDYSHYDMEEGAKPDPKDLFTKRERFIISRIRTSQRYDAVKEFKLRVRGSKNRVKLALKCFTAYKWNTDYGGKAWAEGCRAWLALYNATNLEDILFCIDRAYDLQHNNGVLFNKHKDYEKIEDYIHKALTKKRYAKDVYDVAFHRTFANPYVERMHWNVLPRYKKTVRKYFKHFPRKTNRKIEINERKESIY